MKKSLRLAMAQINCTVGDIDGNCKKIAENIQKAKGYGADIIAFPELAVTGYPPEDLLLKEAFIDDNLEKFRKLTRSINGIIAVLGFVDRAGKDIYNAAAIIYKGEALGVYRKMFLPNYGVFDEARYFKPGTESLTLMMGEAALGITICEDIWHKEGPAKAAAMSGARLILNINASPYHMGKIKEREEIIKDQARTNKVTVAYINMVGGQDELVFDGQSMVIDSAGRVISRADAFKEDLLVSDIEVMIDKAPPVGKRLIIDYGTQPKATLPRRETRPLDPMAEVYQALTLGLSDYAIKNGFKNVVIGLSGGVDSSLVAALAVDALGKENVTGVFMPTRYSSADSERDAKETAANLGIKFMSISIEHIFKLYLMTMEPHFAGLPKNIAEENIQARIRGNILMALSNKFGWLVLTTGNKSEMSTGYATLYGDMAGGFAVIKDVPKTLVYKLARHRNSLSNAIPESVLIKPPTAELRHNQKDEDTLPPYDILDAILKAYIEEDKDLSEIVSMGFARDIVKRALNMVDKSEYKRRQAPPGVKITPKAFGRDRRMPITNRYK